MTRKELLNLLNQAERNLILEKNERHRKMLKKVVDAYRETLHQDRDEQAEKRLIEWLRQNLED